NCSMEICKQLFDIASLFDIVNDLSITTETFNKFAMVELQYRGESPDAMSNSCLHISIEQFFSPLKKGIPVV
ncbi:hypothetical protein GAC27_18980, partial [Bacteroides thetaiotaomicron]